MDYIDNSIKKYVDGKHFSVQTKLTKRGKPVDKNYSFSDYTDLWVACKKIFEGKLSIKGARKQQDVMEKKISRVG